MTAYDELVSSYESEEGYPAESWIEKFDTLDFTAVTPKQAADFLVNRLPAIAKTISCMRVIISDAKDEYAERPLKRIEYITGGWSGAEDLIHSMLRQFWIKHYHTLWKRGGYFVFDVPASLVSNGEQR